jgi:prepilin-type N-terminal cleavage/methylation domain-containing protein
MTARQRGFTLIELVAIIVLLSVGATSLLALFGQVGRSIATNQETQTGAQLAQACAEQIMAFRRNTAAGYGYANVAVGNDTGACDAGFTAVGGFAVTDTPVVNVTAHNSASLPACPSATAGACKQVDIQVNKGGVRAASLSLLLVNY